MDYVRSLTLEEVDKRYRHGVTNIAAKYASYVGPEVDKEDYITYALLYMHRRQPNFRPEFNVPFDTWMYMQAKSEIQHRKRNDEYYLAHVTSVEEVRVEDKDDYTTWAETLGVRKAVSHLKPKQKLVVLRRYWCDETFTEVGKSMGITQQRACELHGKAINHLRGELI